MKLSIGLKKPNIDMEFYFPISPVVRLTSFHS